MRCRRWIVFYCLGFVSGDVHKWSYFEHVYTSRQHSTVQDASHLEQVSPFTRCVVVEFIVTCFNKNRMRFECHKHCCFSFFNCRSVFFAGPWGCQELKPYISTIPARSSLSLCSLCIHPADIFTCLPSTEGYACASFNILCAFYTHTQTHINVMFPVVVKVCYLCHYR